MHDASAPHRRIPSLVVWIHRTPHAVRILILLLVLTAWMNACNGSEDTTLRTTAQPGDLTRYVDPFIGTRGQGNAVPGPCLPHAMVKLSPDTNAEPGSVDGYEYKDDRIQGFSHTHLEGPGGGSNGYSHILLIPTTGDLRTSTTDYASLFAHEQETAHPGYYAVNLLDYDVFAELTSTPHCGFHRYTFPESQEARILIDVGHTRGTSLNGSIEIVDNRTVKGYGLYSMHPLIAVLTLADPGTTARMRVYFHAEFDRPFTSFGTWRGNRNTPGSNQTSGRNVGAWLGYETEKGDVVRVKVGISYIDADQARENLEREIPDWDFQGTREAARATWKDLLGRVEVQGGSDQDRSKFYTALYHSLLQPTDYTEYGRFWSGSDGTGTVHETRGFRFYSDDWCTWDTFRTTHPLQTVLEPERRSDIVQSYVHVYEQGGWLPKCSWQATGYSRVMIGNHALSVILDARRKGLDRFDSEKAYAAMRKSATEDNENLGAGWLCGYLNLGTPPAYESLGFVPQECDPTQSVSMTLEYAYNDWCVAQMALLLGRGEDHQAFLKRSRNYVNHWNPDTKFMQPRSGNGEWVLPFDPLSESGFCEADSWKYTWFVPHDPAGLVELMGGAEAFVRKLDAFFEGGHYDPSNEPAFHVPYLYVYGGAPYKTQQRVRALMEEAYTALPSGLPGNDDAGATSAWFVLSAMGFYPVCPGEPVYVIGSPLFSRIVLHLDPEIQKGERFVIEAKGNSSGSPYIQSATLNGKALERAWIRHQEIVEGGTLVLKMGPEPSAWAGGTENLPPPGSGVNPG